MSSLIKNLNEIYQFLKKWRRPVVDSFKKGLSSEEIGKRINNIGLHPTQELLELYQWRNGTDVPSGTALDGVHFFPGFYLMSLDDSIAQYLSLKDDGRWDANWFPIFANGGGDFYAVDFSIKENDVSPIIGFLLGEEEHPIEYQSLTAMLQTLSECFKQDVFEVTEEDYLDMNDVQHAIVARKYNPDVSFWNPEH